MTHMMLGGLLQEILAASHRFISRRYKTQNFPQGSSVTFIIKDSVGHLEPLHSIDRRLDYSDSELGTFLGAAV